jgi:chaperonin GroES
MTPSPRGFRPLSDRILILPDKLSDRTPSGLIIIPNGTKQPPPLRGLVIAMGPGMLMKDGNRWPMPTVTPGIDRIAYSFGAGLVVEIDGTRYLLIRDDDVLAVEDRPVVGHVGPGPTYHGDLSEAG